MCVCVPSGAQKGWGGKQASKQVGVFEVVLKKVCLQSNLWLIHECSKPPPPQPPSPGLVHLLDSNHSPTTQLDPQPTAPQHTPRRANPTAASRKPGHQQQQQQQQNQQQQKVSSLAGMLLPGRHPQAPSLSSATPRRTPHPARTSQPRCPPAPTCRRSSSPCSPPFS